MTEAPLSFKDWSRMYPKIPFDQKLVRYDEYVTEHMQERVASTEGVHLENIKAKYKEFLKRLTVIYQDDPDIVLLEGMDFDNEAQLTTAIPIFAKKIKDIAKYYHQKRIGLREKRFELSKKGTSESIESKIEDLLLTKYTTESGYIHPEIRDEKVARKMGSKYEITQKLSVEVDEKYNTSTTPT